MINAAEMEMAERLKSTRSGIKATVTRKVNHIMQLTCTVKMWMNSLLL